MRPRLGGWMAILAHVETAGAKPRQRLLREKRDGKCSGQSLVLYKTEDLGFPYYALRFRHLP
jgi:hypothetical protein